MIFTYWQHQDVAWNLVLIYHEPKLNIPLNSSLKCIVQWAIAATAAKSNNFNPISNIFCPGTQSPVDYLLPSRGIWWKKLCGIAMFLITLKAWSSSKFFAWSAAIGSYFLQRMKSCKQHNNNQSKLTNEKICLAFPLILDLISASLIYVITNCNQVSSIEIKELVCLLTWFLLKNLTISATSFFPDKTFVKFSFDS